MIKNKLITTLICLFLAVAMHAEEHMTFMDIAFDHTISEFTDSLKAKGFSISPKSNTAPAGKRLFTGKFNNNLVNLTVNYGVHTKQILTVVVHMGEQTDFEDFMLVYNAMKRVVTEKYCTEGDVINEQGDINTMPTYGMKMDYGRVLVGVEGKQGLGVTLTYEDTKNVREERIRRYDPVE